MSNRLNGVAGLLVALGAGLLPAAATAQTKLLRFPDIAGARVAPHMFRKAGLGPLVGKRCWGGVVGISGLGPMIDGGSVGATRSSSGRSRS